MVSLTAIPPHSLSFKILFKIVQRRAVLAIKRYGGHHQIPFLLSLAVEHLARVLRQRQGKGTRRDASKVEKNEWNKRHQAFWWYLVRGPMWESFTKWVQLPFTGR